MDVRSPSISDLASGLGEAKSIGKSIISAGSGSAAAVALATVTSLVVAGVVYTRYEYNRHQSEKHMKRVREIMELYRKYLVEITSPGMKEHPTLPPPFTIQQLSDSKAADSKADESPYVALRLNQAIRKDLMQDKSISTDTFLLPYSEHIKSAKQHIMGFYDDRLDSGQRSLWTKGDANDVTSSVLTYLLIILSEHCTNFQGFDVDIAILDGIISFIRGFISLPRDTRLESSSPQKRQRFERLKATVRELCLAQRVLRDHSSARTMKSYVDELMSSCNKDLIPGLIKLFAKLIVPEKEWKFVDTATTDLIAAGLLRPAYENTHNVLQRNGAAVPILNSIFKGWLQNITAYQLDPKIITKLPFELKDEDLPGIKKLFEKLHPNFLTLKSPQPNAAGSVGKNQFVTVGFDEECQLSIVTRMPRIPEPSSFLVVREGVGWKVYEIHADRQQVELRIASVMGLGAALDGLPASKPVESLSKREKQALNVVLTKYRNRSQLKARAQIFTELVCLLDQLTDLDQFCQKLSDAIRDLGEIYITHPHHCNFIFESLSAFGQEIDNGIGRLLHSFEKVEDNEYRAHDMLLKEQAELRSLLKSKLFYIRDKVARNIAGILDKHHFDCARKGDPKAAGIIDYDAYAASQKKMVIQGMLLLAAKVTDKYKIDSSRFELTSVRRAGRSGSVSSISLDLKGEEKHFLIGDSPLVAHTRRIEAKYGGPASTAPSSMPGEEKQYYEVPQESPELILKKIRNRLDEIYTAGAIDENTREAYERLFTALDQIDLKVKMMEKEKNSPARLAKAEATRKLTILLCKKTLEFVKLPKEQQATQALNFTNKVIKAELSASRNNFLDEHKSAFAKFLRAVKELALCLVGYGFYLAYKRGGFFETDTRAAAHQVAESSAQLTTQLTPVEL